MATLKKWDAFFNRADLTTTDTFQMVGIDLSNPTLANQNQRTPITQLLRSGKNLSDLTNFSDARVNLGLNGSQEIVMSGIFTPSAPFISSKLYIIDSSVLGAVTFNLPTALSVGTGFVLIVKSNNTGTTSLIPNGSDTVEYSLNIANNNAIAIVSDGVSAWKVLWNENITGDITVVSGSAGINSNVVSNIKLAQMAANTVKANITGITANSSDVSLASFKTWLGLGSFSANQMVFTDASGIATSSSSYTVNGSGALTITGAMTGASFNINAGVPADRLIVLNSNGANNHQYNGWGISTTAFKSQLTSTGANFEFYAAASSSSSVQLLQMQGSGLSTFGSGVSNPAVLVGSQSTGVCYTTSAGTYFTNAISGDISLKNSLTTKNVLIGVGSSTSQIIVANTLTTFNTPTVFALGSSGATGVSITGTNPALNVGTNGVLGQASNANGFFTGSASGDLCLRQASGSNSIRLGIGTNAAEFVLSSSLLALTVGVQLPTSGGTPGNLNYYEENTAFNVVMNCPDGATHNLSFTATRVGKEVTLTWESLAVTATSAVNFSSTVGSPIPAKFRPISSVGAILKPIIINDNSAFAYGTMAIDTTGNVFVGVGAGSAVFTASGLASIGPGSISYCVS